MKACRSKFSLLLLNASVTEAMNPTFALISYLKPADANSYMLLPSNIGRKTYTDMEGYVVARSSYQFRNYYGKIKLTDKWTHVRDNATCVYFSTLKEKCDTEVH